MTTVHAALLASLLVLVVGCSDSSSPARPELPAVDSFAEGTCRTVAEDVRTLGRLLAELGEGPEVDAEVLEALRESQDAVRAVAEGAEPSVQPALDHLSVATGLVRIRATGNSYEPVLGERALEAYEGVLDVCTGPGAAG
jgi:hypothetical protein